MNNAPRTLTECQRLLEIPDTVAFSVDFRDPIFMFLNTDNRLMKVVKTAQGDYAKLNMETTHG